MDLGETTIMIGYATIGSNDLEKAKGFYDAVLTPLGGKRAFASDRMQGYAGAGGAMLMVCTPYDGEKAVPGNGAKNLMLFLLHK